MANFWFPTLHQIINSYLFNELLIHYELFEAHNSTIEFKIVICIKNSPFKYFHVRAFYFQHCIKLLLLFNKLLVRYELYFKLTIQKLNYQLKFIFMNRKITAEIFSWQSLFNSQHFYQINFITGLTLDCSEFSRWGLLTFPNEANCIVHLPRRSTSNIRTD